MGLHRASRKMAKGTGFIQGRTIRLSQLALEIWKWRSESLRGKDPVQEEGCAEIQEKVKSQREAQARTWAASVIEPGPKRQRVSGDFCVSLRPNGIFYTWHPRDFFHRTNSSCPWARVKLWFSWTELLLISSSPSSIKKKSDKSG